MQDGQYASSDDQDETELDPDGSTVTLYEAAVPDPTMDALQIAGRTNHSTKLEVETTETQVFLSQQLKILDQFRQKTDETSREESRQKHIKKMVDDDYDGVFTTAPVIRQPEAKVLEHIGPVQFNMGGIQVDADDMVQRLKERQTYGSSPEPHDTGSEGALEEAPPMDTENLQAFFTGLMNRGSGTGR